MGLQGDCSENSVVVLGDLHPQYVQACSSIINVGASLHLGDRQLPQ